MASTSSATPSQSTRKLIYDVFLSFRGEDIRKTFLDHLNDRLKLKGFRTLKDDERLEKGKCIAPTLLQAIQESRFAIVVFSKDYASSTWCLDEVAKIMECKEKFDQVVVPIFYNVEPSHVRNQTGSFEEAFVKHEENFKDDEGKVRVERWRKALAEASNLAGHHLHGDKYNGRRRIASLDGSLPGRTTDIGPLTKLGYLNLSGKDFEHLPDDISRLRRLQYLDFSGCQRLKELPELPANIRELYAHYRLASERNITELATKYSKLYSVSFSYDGYVNLSTKELAKKFIQSHSITEPFLNRNTPFTVTYPANMGITWYYSKKMSLDLNPTWYSQNFVGFVVCFPLSGWGSHSDMRPFKHREVIAKLAHKDNENEVLQTKCVIGTLYNSKDLVCFAYIPISSLWPESKTTTNDVTPNHYSVFEVAIGDWGVSRDYWSCGLLYTDDELLIEAIQRKREQEQVGSSGSDSGEECEDEEMGESVDGDEKVYEYEEEEKEEEEKEEEEEESEDKTFGHHMEQRKKASRERQGSGYFSSTFERSSTFPCCDVL